MICPEDGISNPAIILSVVVLPQPDGPRNVRNSPGLTVRFTLSTAKKVSLSLTYVRQMPRSSSEMDMISELRWRRRCGKVPEQAD